MKHSLRLLLLLLLAAGSPRAAAQGALVFANRLIAEGVNAPVTYCGPLTPGGPFSEGLAFGTNFLAQLLVNGRPAGDPVPFREGTQAGSVAPQVIYPEGIPGGTAVSVVMVAWFARLGSTYAEAVSKGIGGLGFSNPINVVLTGVPNTPAPLVGLQSFHIFGCIPEPSSGLLLLLGTVCLLRRRRRV